MIPRIYLDHAASSPISPEVINEMMEVAQANFGNPSSIHREGAKAKNVIEECRKKIAAAIHTSPSQIFFTSGASESNNLIIRSLFESGIYSNIISSPIEHPSIINTLRQLNNRYNLPLNLAKPDSFGIIDPSEVESLLTNSSGKSMVFLMHSNNELGSLLPILEISKICKAHQAYFHSDAVQSIGLMDINVTELGLNSLSASAHKFNGPKGIGFVFIDNPNQIHPLIIGGSQERNLRAGTENLLGIVGMTKALELALSNMLIRYQHLSELHSYLKNGILNLNIPCSLNSPDSSCLPKILNVYFEYSEKTDWLMMNLDIEGIAVSGGSACSSGSEKASAISEYIRPNSKGRSIRFSLSHLNTIAELDIVLNTLKRLLS